MICPETRYRLLERTYESQAVELLCVSSYFYSKYLVLLLERKKRQGDNLERDPLDVAVYGDFYF
jgi:hypothetical protein